MKRLLSYSVVYVCDHDHIAFDHSLPAGLVDVAIILNMSFP